MKEIWVVCVSAGVHVCLHVFMCVWCCMCLLCGFMWCVGACMSVGWGIPITKILKLII